MTLGRTGCSQAGRFQLEGIQSPPLGLSAGPGGRQAGLPLTVSQTSPAQELVPRDGAFVPLKAPGPGPPVPQSQLEPSKLPFMRELKAAVPFQGDSGPWQPPGTGLAPGGRAGGAHVRPGVPAAPTGGFALASTGGLSVSHLLADIVNRL